MSLLVDLMWHAEDPAYAEAAAGRPDGRGRRSGPRGIAVVVGLGLLTGVAGAAVRSAAQDDSPSRAGVLARVRQATAESDGLSRRAAGLRADLAARRDAALVTDSRGRAEAARLATLELAAGTVAVTGDGLVATLDDRPAGRPGGALPRGGQAGSGRVLDRDLQDLVNGLWTAGAEALSVNDLRLTARTAIRSAGEAVLVDYRPVSPPYVVRAIGDPGRLLPGFLDGTSGRRLSTYTSLYGLRFDVQPARALRLPAGRVPDPRSAVPGPS